MTEGAGSNGHHRLDLPKGVICFDLSGIIEGVGECAQLHVYTSWWVNVSDFGFEIVVFGRLKSAWSLILRRFRLTIMGAEEFDFAKDRVWDLPRTPFNHELLELYKL